MEPNEIRRAAEILKQLVRIRTAQPLGDERDAALYIASLFPEERIGKQFIEHGGNRASLILTLQGDGTGRSIAVAGHMDTITVGDAGCGRTPRSGPRRRTGASSDAGRRT